MKTNYDQLLRILDAGRTTKSREHRKIANNTYLERAEDHLDIKYYSTGIVKMYPGDTAEIFMNNWWTVSTRSRINWLTRARFHKGGVVINERTPERWIKCRACGGLEWTQENKALMAFRLGVNPRYSNTSKRWSSDYEIEKWIQSGCSRCFSRIWNHQDKCYTEARPRDPNHHYQQMIGGVAKTVPFYDGMRIDCNTGFPI